MKTRVAVILIVVLGCTGCYDYITPETLVLPLGYEGWVGVAYGIEGAARNEVQEGRIVIAVPGNGIAVSSNEYNCCIVREGDRRFLYQSSRNERMRTLPFVPFGVDIDQLRSDSVYVLAVTILGVDVLDESVRWDGGIIYAIGKPRRMDSLLRREEDFIERMYEAASAPEARR